MKNGATLLGSFDSKNLMSQIRMVESVLIQPF